MAYPPPPTLMWQQKACKNGCMREEHRGELEESRRSGRRNAARGAGRLCLPPFGKSPNVHRGSGSQGERQRTSLPPSLPPSQPPSLPASSPRCTSLHPLQLFSLQPVRACVRAAHFQSVHIPPCMRVARLCRTRAFFATLSIHPVIIISSHAVFFKILSVYFLRASAPRRASALFRASQ